MEQDITARKQADEALRESELRFRQAMQIGKCFPFDWNPLTDEVIRSPACADILGLTGTDIVHDTSQRYFQRILPEDRDQFVNTIRQLTPTADTYVAGYRLDRGDGSIAHLEETAQGFFDSEGKLIRLLGIVADVTERKRSEEALFRERSLLDSVMRTTDVMLVLLDPQFNFVWVNPAYAQTCKMPPEEMVGQNHFALYPDAENEAIFRQVRDTGERVFYKDKPFVFPDQPQRGVTYWDWSVAPVKDAGGNVTNLVFSLRETTKFKQAEEQLKALNETLEQRVAERTAESQWRANQLQKLAAQMSQAEERERRRLSQALHDGLQQVLVAARLRLTAAAQKARDSQAAVPIKEAANLIDESIAESRSLTKELSPPVLYDGGLAAGLEWLGRETEKKYELPVTVTVAPEMEPDDLTTKVFVFQAVRELILNAVKHAHASSLRVCLSSGEDDRLQVVVEDDGTGFDAGAITKKEGGGFGLFSIKERLEVIGGEFTIASSPLEGTKATIATPCRRPRLAPSPAGTAAERLALPRAASTRANRIRVLLADDHPVLRKGLADMLMEHPDLNLVGEAEDGQEALEMAIRLRPDVILMDITMPRMDGIEATRQIKRGAPGVAVIGLSMHDTEDMIAKMKDAGAGEYLMKTVGLEEMIAAIVRVCP